MKHYVLFILTAAVLNAADSGSAALSGRVVDPSGAVVPGVELRLKNRAEGGTVTLSTDRYGEFRAGQLRPGVYELTAQAPGFAPLERSEIALANGETLRLELVLRISSSHQQVTVTTKAPRAEDAMETSAANHREVLEIREGRESTAKDVGEAIAKLDGVWSIRKGGIANDIVLRGFQQGNINVLVDGERIYAACPSHMDPSAFHVDFAEIETVEVTKGPFDIRNQGSLGGSVNVSSKRPPAGLQFSPVFRTGSFGFYNPSVSASMASGRFNALAGYSYRRSNPYLDGSGRPVTDYANFSPAGRRAAAFGAATGWGRVGAQIGRSELNLSYTHQAGGLTLYPALKMDAPYDNAERLNAGWTLTEASRPVETVRAQVYFTRVNHWMTDELRTTAAGSPLGYSMGSFAGTRALGGRLEAQRRNLIVGVESYDRGWNVDGTMRMGAMYTSAPSIPAVRVITGGIYAQYQRLFGRLAVTAGARTDIARNDARDPNRDTTLYWAYHNTRSTSAHDAGTSGSVRLTYSLSNGVEFFAGGGSTVRFPDPEERYYTAKRTGSDWVGNPALNPTRNNEADLGVNVRGRFFTVRSTLFYSRLSDFVTMSVQPLVNPVAGVMNTWARSYAGVDARLYGGEVSYSVGFTPDLILTGGVSYTRGRQHRTPGMPGSNIAEMPPLRSRVGLRFGRKLFFGEITEVLSARQDRIDTLVQEQPTAGYAVTGLKMGIHARRLQLAAGVDNLLNHFYYEHLSFQRDPYRSGVRIPEPGRTIYLNLSAAF